MATFISLASALPETSVEKDIFLPAAQKWCLTNSLLRNAKVAGALSLCNEAEGRGNYLWGLHKYTYIYIQIDTYIIIYM